MSKWHTLTLTAYNFLINWLIFIRNCIPDWEGNCLLNFVTVHCLSLLWTAARRRTWSRLSKTRPWRSPATAPQPIAPQCWDWSGSSLRYSTFESSMYQNQLLQIYLSIEPWYQLNHRIYELSTKLKNKKQLIFGKNNNIWSFQMRYQHVLIKKLAN